MTDNLTTFMCRLSRNLRASTSWNPQGLFKPVQGLLYPFLCIFSGNVCTDVLGDANLSVTICIHAS
jgi:hypothetical protein